MAKVFISYSRKDIEFAKRLTGELHKSELDFWIDWEGIPSTVDWWREIEKGIEESDAFLFLISPDSSKSNVCKREIDHAIINGKRLIPLVIRDTKGDEVHPKLSSLNWIFFREQDNFYTSITKLITSIHTDFDWVETQRRLQVKALEWERNHKENSFLLRGKDLQDAKTQLTANSSKEPYPTDLQRNYVFESHRNEEMQRRSSKQRRNIVAIIGCILISTIVLAMTGQLNRFLFRPLPMEWVMVPAGEFMMGSTADILNLCSKCIFSDEQPQHLIYLDAYQIGKYEVTNEQYNQCVKAGDCDAPAQKIFSSLEYATYPVVYISWNDANSFCRWNDGNGRLPTEQEWEKAARGIDGRTYPWGEIIDDTYSRYTPSNIPFGPVNLENEAVAVGSYSKDVSPYGVFDMAGNVMEWSSDWYGAYPGNQVSNSMYGTTYKVVRGGAWNQNEIFLRTSRRNSLEPESNLNNVGFRCARD